MRLSCRFTATLLLLFLVVVKQVEAWRHHHSAAAFAPPSLASTTSASTSRQRQQRSRSNNAIVILSAGGFGGSGGKQTSKENKLKPKQQWDRYVEMKKATKVQVAARVMANNDEEASSSSSEWLVVGSVKSTDNAYTKIAVARQRALIAEVSDNGIFGKTFLVADNKEPSFFFYCLTYKPLSLPHDVVLLVKYKYSTPEDSTLSKCLPRMCWNMATRRMVLILAAMIGWWLTSPFWKVMMYRIILKR